MRESVAMKRVEGHRGPLRGGGMFQQGDGGRHHDGTTTMARAETTAGIGFNGDGDNPDTSHRTLFILVKVRPPKRHVDF